MKISVIIPSYKPAGYLWECLDSLVWQTLGKSDFEVIVVLNGCCEPWKTEIEDYINSHDTKNFKLFQTDTPGVSNARNMGMDAAKGEYITFIDDDDYVSCEFLEAMLEKAAPDTAVLTDSWAFMDGSPRKRLEKYKPHCAYLQYCGKQNVSLFHARSIFNGPCMKLLPSNFIQDRYFDVRFKNGEDALFCFLISRSIKKLSFADTQAIYYRRYRENSAVTTRRTKRQIITNSMRLIYAYCSIYFKSPLKHNFAFFLARILASVKTVFHNVRISSK